MHGACFPETRSVGDFVETRSKEGRNVDYPGVIDYFARTENRDCYGEATDRVVDISVHSDCPGRNHNGSSHRLVEIDLLDICNGHPQIDACCPTDNDLPRVGNRRHVEFGLITRAARHPYSGDVDNRPAESDRCGARSNRLGQ